MIHLSFAEIEVYIFYWGILTFKHPFPGNMERIKLLGSIQFRPKHVKPNLNYFVDIILSFFYICTIYTLI